MQKRKGIGETVRVSRAASDVGWQALWSWLLAPPDAEDPESTVQAREPMEELSRGTQSAAAKRKTRKRTRSPTQDLSKQDTAAREPLRE